MLTDETVEPREEWNFWVPKSWNSMECYPIARVPDFHIF